MRHDMVAAVRRGASMRAIARAFGVGLFTVQRWVNRAGSNRLDRVDWSDRSSRPRTVANRTRAETERAVLTARETLRTTSDLGEYGAAAIRVELIRQSEAPPSVRTVGRILERRGVLDRRTRIRRPSPPPGWYLPAVADASAELDSFDTVSGLVIRGGINVEVLNGVSLHGGLIASWPRANITARSVTELLLSHWKLFGIPDYAQFDNDTIFQGPHQHRDVVGRVMRTCLLLKIIPVFAPPREPGFQAAVEGLNGRWQDKVWSRFQHESLVELEERSNRFVSAHRLRSAFRIERAPIRRPFPVNPPLNLQTHPSGRIIFVRRTNDAGAVSLLARTFAVDPLWTHRLVRAEVLIDQSVIRFFALRRRDPSAQPLLAEVPYSLPRRSFLE